MLPQTQAFVLETYRWRPVTVGGTCTSLFALCVLSNVTLTLPRSRTQSHKGHYLGMFVTSQDILMNAQLSCPQQNYCIPAGASVIGNHWSALSLNTDSGLSTEHWVIPVLGLLALIRSSFPILKSSTHNVG